MFGLLWKATARISTLAEPETLAVRCVAVEAEACVRVFVNDEDVELSQCG